MTQVVAQGLPVVGLIVLLVVAVRHLPAWAEATVSLAAVALALAPGLLGHAQVDAAQVGTALADLAPVVGFLATILVVSQVCARAGLFTATAGLLRPSGARPAVRLLTVAFLIAAAVTAVLSLDATVVLLVPVVVAAASALGTSHRPSAYACLRMANSSSLLLPVSNLTNLLALPHLDVTFLGFAARTLPAWVAVLVVEYVGLRVFFRRDLAERVEDAGPEPDPTPVPVVPAVTVVVMLAGFAALSPFGVEPVFVSLAAAVVLVAWAMTPSRKVIDVRSTVGSAQLPFAVFVLALGVVVAAIARGFLGDAVEHLVPSSTRFVGLLGIAVLATVVACVLTNLSATLLVVPLVAPMGTTAVLAALVGLNVGSGLLLTGSLANLLWRRGLAASGVRTGLGEFHRLSLLLTPVTVVVAVGVLSLTS